MEDPYLEHKLKGYMDELAIEDGSILEGNGKGLYLK